jgi:hypothetical protein
MHCGHGLTDGEIRDGWCDSCGKRLPGSGAFTAAPVAVAAAVDIEQPQRGSRAYVVDRSDVLGWGTVRTALAQVVVGAALLAIGLSGILAMTFASASRHAQLGPVDDAGAALLSVFLISFLSVTTGLGSILILIGVCTCCGAPASSGAFSWAIGAVACLVISVLLLVFLYVAGLQNTRVALENERRAFEELNRRRGPIFGQDFRQPGRPAPAKPLPFGEVVLKATSYASALMMCLHAILFLLFLRRTAAVTRHHGQGTHAVVLLLVFLVYALGIFGLALRTELAHRGNADPFMAILGPDSGELLLRVILAITAALALWFAVLAGLVRGAVSRMMLRV